MTMIRLMIIFYYLLSEKSLFKIFLNILYNYPYINITKFENYITVYHIKYNNCSYLNFSC